MLYFIVGILAGAYLAQNYQIPDVKRGFNDCLERLKNLEKENIIEKKGKK